MEWCGCKSTLAGEGAVIGTSFLAAILKNLKGDLRIDKVTFFNVFLYKKKLGKVVSNNL